MHSVIQKKEEPFPAGKRGVDGMRYYREERNFSQLEGAGQERGGSSLRENKKPFLSEDNFKGGEGILQKREKTLLAGVSTNFMVRRGIL